MRKSSKLERLYIDVPIVRPGSPGAYAMAALAVAAATALRLAIDPWVVGLQFTFYFPAIMLVAFVSGTRAGALSLVLSVLSTWYFILVPRFSFQLSGLPEVVDLAIFTPIATINLTVVVLLRAALAHMIRLRALDVAIFESNPNAILISDRDGRIVRLNERAVALFGYPREKLLDQPIEILLPDDRRIDEAPQRAAFLANPDAREAGVSEDVFARRADGTEFPVEVQIGPVHHGGDARLIVAARDVSRERAATLALAENREHQAVLEERQRGAEELRQANMTLAKIIEAAPVAIWAIDAEERISIWNPAVEKIYGHPAAKIIGQHWRDFSGGRVPDNAISSDALLETAIARDGFQNLELRRFGKDGRVHELSVSAAVLRDSAGASTGILFIAHDISETKQLEQKLRQAQKMEVIGQLTGGVAHDFNNLLAVIYGNLELIGDSPDADQEIKELAGEALTAAEHGASLTHQLLAFSRRQQLTPTTVEVGTLISETVVMLKRMIEVSITIDTRITPGLWRSRIDSGQLTSALLNLAVNARDAMTSGGTLTFSAENTVLDEEYCRQYDDVVPGDYVRISIADTGTGMPKDILERVTEPFFTTKSVGKGSGLGLSMVYGFLKQSGGHLAIYSEEGQGTTVKLFLPRLSTNGEGEPREIMAPLPTATARQVILLVEDNAPLRKLQARMLTSLGYRMVEAADGASALLALDDAGHIDLMLTDIVLPGGQSGPALAQAARQKRADLKVIFMSGYAPRDVMRDYDLSAAQCLSKPFSRADLAHALRTELNSEALIEDHTP